MNTDDDKVIDLRPYLKKRRRSYRSYGERICCPECDSHEYWKFYVKQHIDKKLYVTSIVCTSDECDGNTIIEIKDGYIK